PTLGTIGIRNALLFVMKAGLFYVCAYLHKRGSIW
ncbi:MAG: hypothetical protein ACI9SX_001061, partial [Pseudoalteromonas tetraodonis]